MSEKEFTRKNMDAYLKEIAKEYRKRSGKTVPAEIILIGGAAVVINYGFRAMTYDMDAIINASSSMKEAINYVGDKFNLPNGWMNTDFIRTDSYTPKIENYAKYYRTYSNVVTFRTISGEYLVAMKLKSGRKYKYDRSDVIGVLLEQKKMGEPLTLDMIKKAVTDLYGSYEALEEEVRQFIETALKSGDYEKMYDNVRKAEVDNKEILLNYQDEKPGVVNKDNVNDILNVLRKKKKK
ncbi:MAG: hypothetical protein E7242_00710 [Lachnospiraceae bacterium]|nr:hypothetical protein [Lachnospiraceae bacterium]